MHRILSATRGGEASRRTQEAVIAMAKEKGARIHALASAATDEGAEAIAFGRPAGPESSFSLPDLKALVAQIEAKTGIETYIV